MCPGVWCLRGVVRGGPCPQLWPASPLASQVLLQTSPYHVDSLLQLSDACRFQDDQEMARDLVGKRRLLPSPPVPSPECLTGWLVAQVPFGDAGI